MPITTVQSMMPARKGRFVRISLNDNARSVFSMSPQEVRRMDIRVFLDRREPDAIPFSA